MSDKKSEGFQVVMKTKQVHTDLITIMAYCPARGYCVSFAGGMPEVWDPETLEMPEQFKAMSDTDLFMLCDDTVLAATFSQ